MLIYWRVCVYIYMLAPPKIYLCSSRDRHDETHCILQFIIQWVWSCKLCKPFKETVSLQHIEHSSKHAVFLSEEVQFPFRKLFSLRSSLRSIIQYFKIYFKTPESYTISSVWLRLSIAVKMCNGWCSLQHSLKRRLLLKENAAYRLQSALKTR